MHNLYVFICIFTNVYTLSIRYISTQASFAYDDLLHYTDLKVAETEKVKKEEEAQLEAKSLEKTPERPKGNCMIK